MYKSPIEIVRALGAQLAQEFDAEFFRAIQKVGFEVDREELLKALRYDRDQYDKGFADGKVAAMDELVRCVDCIHFSGDMPDGWNWCKENERNYLCDDDFCSDGKRRDDNE